MAVRNLTLNNNNNNNNNGKGPGGMMGESTFVDRVKSLYPMVNEAETPLPRSWSPKDKFNFIGLSLNNLRVHYKGIGVLCLGI